MRTPSLLLILTISAIGSGCNRTEPLLPTTSTTTTATAQLGDQQTATAPRVVSETQEQAVAGIEKLGGEVKRESNEPNAPVVEVTFRGNQEIFTHAELEHLEGLQQLQRLDVSFTNMTSADLEHLKGLNQLQVLNLEGTKVDDWGLEYLKGLNQLQKLDLEDTHVTDEAIKKLQESLPGCQIIR